jgi:peptidoglycan/LPS O-acetylase OafA/YrhL
LSSFSAQAVLITGRLLASRDEPHRFRSFYVRRALRIFPLYYAVLVVVFVVIPIVGTVGAPSVAIQLPYWLYYSNFTIPMSDVPYIELGHFWSLTVEEQFYAVWPALLFLTSRPTARAACMAIILNVAGDQLGGHRGGSALASHVHLDADARGRPCARLARRAGMG